jgi:general nucleoside transport system ATP-binding protein
LVVIARGRVSPSVPIEQASVAQVGEWMSGLFDHAT